MYSRLPMMKGLCFFILLLLPIAVFPQKESIKMFLDCNCEKRYIQQEINFISHVRDQGLANVKLFIYDIANGSGGRTYRLEFTGEGSFADLENELSYDTTANMSSDEVRKGLVQRIKTGLLKYVIQSDVADNIDYSITKEGLKERQDINFDDPWNNWIFEVRGEVDVNSEASRNQFRYELGFESDRVTEKWRIRADLEMNRFSSKFENDGEEFASERERYSGFGSVVRSLSDHWSAGIFGGARHDTYTNLNVSLDLRPALEYNIFPYREVLRREIVFAYKIGYIFNDYMETTIFGKDKESLFSHSVDVQLRFRQPWGNIFTRIVASSFLNDWSKNRLQMDSYLSIRILKGLSVRFSGDLKLIQDQINLPAGSASIEDVLLQQKQIATNFEIGFGVGISYTFGSAFNNIINTRL
ncbi:DUF481 domain-containing protein [Sediminicola sp. 1XM1-17]|uniref:DUF481 domain-containing protein n=1 Tax=Sediminicola sp. 1XM1-17 TaxID=3127702 RepID=UPI003077DA11